MKRIIANRGMDKTTNLLEMALAYAEANPQDTVFFAAATINSAYFIEQKMLGREWPSNFNIVAHVNIDTATRGRHNVKVFIDEIDLFLQDLKVVGYSMTLGEDLF